MKQLESGGTGCRATELGNWDSHPRLIDSSHAKLSQLPFPTHMLASWVYVSCVMFPGPDLSPSAPALSEPLWTACTAWSPALRNSAPWSAQSGASSRLPRPRSSKWTQCWTEEGSQKTWSCFCCWITFPCYNLCSFPKADVINYHQLGDLKQ